MIILGIESSCDETAAAVLSVDDGGNMTALSNVVNSQIAIHRLYGGVVPEIASRAHIECICDVVNTAIQKAGIEIKDIGLVAVTANPGLIGALLVGVNFAKSFAFANRIPLVAVNHMKAHIAAAYVESVADQAPKPPFLALAVSGGHTSLYLVKSYTDYEEIGATRDDAIGESFDKVGRLIGLPYPAGAAFDRLCKDSLAILSPDSPTIFSYGKTQAHKKSTLKLPSPALTDGSLDFSFSGLKTASVNYIHRCEQLGVEVDKTALSAEFTYAAVEAVYSKVKQALAAYPHHGLVVAGGVAANSHLRQALEQAAKEMETTLAIPPLSLCGDNGLMVAAQGYHEYLAGHLADTHLNGSAADLL